MTPTAPGILKRFFARGKPQRRSPERFDAAEERPDSSAWYLTSPPRSPLEGYGCGSRGLTPSDSDSVYSNDDEMAVNKPPCKGLDLGSVETQSDVVEAAVSSSPRLSKDECEWAAYLRDYCEVSSKHGVWQQRGIY